MPPSPMKTAILLEAAADAELKDGTGVGLGHTSWGSGAIEHRIRRAEQSAGVIQHDQQGPEPGSSCREVQHQLFPSGNGRGGRARENLLRGNRPPGGGSVERERAEQRVPGGAGHWIRIALGHEKARSREGRWSVGRRYFVIRQAK